MITQEEYLVCEQPTREIFVQFNILNKQDRQIDSLVGVATGGGVSIDADSTHRRSGNIELAVKDDKYIPKPHSSIWFNNRCEIKIGIKSYQGHIVWFKVGRFVFSDVEIEEEEATTYISCQLLDYMSLLDGTLGGTLTHQVLIRGRGATIREAILGVLGEEFRSIVSNIVIDDKTTSVIPYDIEKPTNTTKYEILEELVEMYAGYEMFFNTDGYFVVQKIPDYRKDYPIQLFGKNSNFDFTISNSHNLNFSDVKNEVVVWGHTDDDGWQVTGRCCNKGVCSRYSDLKNMKGIKHGDIVYVEREKMPYMYQNSRWVKLSNMYIDPELSVDKIGLKAVAVEDDAIFSSKQADLRARYELEGVNDLGETVSITCVPLYYLDVNKIIYVDYKHIKGYCLITSIGFDFDSGSIMDIEAIKLWEGD